MGPALLEAAERWAEGQGAGSLTGLIKTTNAPSMKMVAALEFETVAHFEGVAAPQAARFDVYHDPHLLALRLAAV